MTRHLLVCSGNTFISIQLLVCSGNTFISMEEYRGMQGECKGNAGECRGNAGECKGNAETRLNFEHTLLLLQLLHC